MGKINRVQLLLGTLAIVCAIPASLQASTSSMTLTSAGGNVLGGVYIGPYYATIDGQSNVPIICDDFVDESFVGESWTANVTTVSSNSPTWVSTREQLSSTQQSKDYAEAAYLATQLMNGATCPPGTPSCASSDYAGDIQFAIWQIFDPAGGGSPFNYISGNDLTNAQAWLTYVQNLAPSISSYANVVVYSPLGQNSPPQEFLRVTVPESATPWILSSDLLLLGGLVLFFRRRSATRRSQ